MKGFGREAWSSGYGRRLVFGRSWVRISAPYTGWTIGHFFTFICCKNCIVCLKQSVHLMSTYVYFQVATLGREQCDQIGRFFAFWASIQSRWQQLFYPNHPHCWAIFVKVSNSFIFSSEIIFGQLLQTFDDFLLVTLVEIKNEMYIFIS